MSIMLGMASRLRKLQNMKTTTAAAAALVFETTRRSFVDVAVAGNESNNNIKKKKVSLYSKISPLGNPNLEMTPTLDDWILRPNKVRESEVKQIVHDLRRRRRFHHALEVSEWMNKKGICAFTTTDHAVQLDLIGKVNGFLEAEKYFNGLTDQHKTDKTYGALLHSYVRQRETDKSLSHFQKMKERGFLSPVAYNDIMRLYIHTGKSDKINDVLEEMKRSGVSPDNLSYRMCINTFGDKMDIGGMESMLTDMEKDPNIIMDWNTYAVVANHYIRGKLKDKAITALKKAEKLVEKDALGYNHLISLQAQLGNKEDVLRLWGLQKTQCKRQINRDYIIMMKSLVKLAEFEEAKKLLTEWNSSGNVYDFQVPRIIIDGYLENNLCGDAKDLLDNLLKDGKATIPGSWCLVAVDLLKNKDIGTCINCMESAFTLPLERKDWKVDSKVVEKLLHGVGEYASIQDAESFVQKLKKFVELDRGMYYALLQGYVCSSKETSKLMEDMEACGIEQDAETKKILGL